MAVPLGGRLHEAATLRGRRDGRTAQVRGATIGDLIEGDDGLPAEKVGEWAKDKHDLLCHYIDIIRSARAKYLPPQPGGAAYIDLFCGPGRCFIEDTREWTDGGAVAAWKASQRGGSPFTHVIIGDADPVRLDAATKRLEALGAPVTGILGEAKETVLDARQAAPPYGLNLAFLDPYSLGALDFQIIDTLAGIRRIDMLIHVSTMDLQRNLDAYLQLDPSPFDAFAPGWREVIRTDQSKERARAKPFRRNALYPRSDLWRHARAEHDLPCPMRGPRWQSGWHRCGRRPRSSGVSARAKGGRAA